MNALAQQSPKRQIMMEGVILKREGSFTSCSANYQLISRVGPSQRFTR
jgi:hypothetical protein